MLLGGSFLGFSILSQATIIPPPTTYNKIVVYGDCVVDKVRALTTSLSETEMGNIQLADSFFPWTPETILYAEFSNNLQAGNVSGLSSPIESWVIFRKRSDDTNYVKVAEIPSANTMFTDYTVKGKRTYEYQVYAKTATELSAPLLSVPIYTDFQYWALMNYDSPDRVWLFDLNLQSGGITVNKPANIFDQTYTQFPVVTFGEKEYITGSISFTSGAMANGSMAYSVDYLDELTAFINNRQPKILKNRYGQAWKVITHDISWNFNDVISEQIADVSFNFTQIGNLEG